VVYRHKVHIGFLAAIVAASNAGGAGSVVGDTTTTLMWIGGVKAAAVFPAFIAAFASLLVVGVPAAMLQQRHAPIEKDPTAGLTLDWGRVGVVVVILLSAVTANVLMNTRAPELGDRLPVIGLAVWGALLVTAAWRRPDWAIIPETLKGSIFLLALVSCASMMPVERLPAASWPTALGLGFVSSVFDNIPLTALALKQGGYDWALLAFAVGFGGSMVWFGSSAGVAISNMYPEAKSVGAWVRHGWFVAVAYVVGFLVMLAVWGWHPTERRERTAAADVPRVWAVQEPPAPAASLAARPRAPDVPARPPREPWAPAASLAPGVREPALPADPYRGRSLASSASAAIRPNPGHQGSFASSSRRVTAPAVSPWASLQLATPYPTVSLR
jgi:hypothetical protein